MSVLKIKDESTGEFIPIPSIKGDTGDAAGFGTVSATVDANHGTPSVTVTASGEDTAKNFAFEFKNLQPAPYDDSVLVARMDSFTNLAEGSTTGDAELIDGRTGADGVTYTNIGGAIRGQVTDLKSEFSDLEDKLYEDGNAVTIQTDTAATLSLDTPTGYVHIKSTDDAIYTGTPNIIDVFGLKQGTFVDATTGVTIEISGNEVYVHGSPTGGFKFDFQRGVFYTDGFSNHTADMSNFPPNHAQYRLCWWPKSGYTLPSNIYIATRNNGTIAPVALNGNSNVFYPDTESLYIAMYSNEALSNLDFKFTMGLKLVNLTYSIEATAKLDYGTKIIKKGGHYELGSFTWAGNGTLYDAVETRPLFEPNPLTENHVYAWFGDSLSQLKELPNLVEDLLNVKVYDCTFAGAPLTYGNPTKFQPTGFMALCSQIVSGDFSSCDAALDEQEASGSDVTERRAHLATLQALDFDSVTDIVLLAGTNDFDNDYVNATNFVSGFESALTTLLGEYPHLIVNVISPPWRGDKFVGVETIPTMEDIVRLEKEVADKYCLPFYDLYHRSGISSLTASVYLQNDILHPSDEGDALLANKCAKFLQSN